MLRITKKQIEMFRRYQYEAYCRQLHAHLTKVYPDCMEGVSFQDIRELIGWAAEKRITKRYDVQRLGEILLASGYRLSPEPESGWIAAHLRVPFPDGTTCIDRLREEQLLRLVEDEAAGA